MLCAILDQEVHVSRSLQGAIALTEATSRSFTMPSFQEQLALLFDKYCSPTLTWIRKSTKIQAASGTQPSKPSASWSVLPPGQVPYVEVALISSLCSLLDARLPSHNLEAGTSEVERCGTRPGIPCTLQAVEAWFVFCIIFATGSSLAEARASRALAFPEGPSTTNCDSGGWS